MSAALDLSPAEITTLAAPAGSLPVEQQERPAAITTSETGAIISMIERASRDPAVDLDKMERLIRMRKEMVADEAERAFAVAMRSAQADMRPIGADATNPQTKSKYATYAKLDTVLRPIYTKHGFSLSFDEQDCPKPEHIRVVCYVSHEAGHTRTYRKDMPADGKGAKGGDVMTKTHATGAAASYGARYLLKGIFNIAVGEEDKDGNEPPAKQADRPRITEDQVLALRDLIEAAGATPERFCAHIKVGSLEEIFADKFAAACAILRQRIERGQ
jgi:hypothetical protein